MKLCWKLCILLIFLLLSGCDDNSDDSQNSNMVYVEGGSYYMGNHFNDGSADEVPIHEVYVSSFYIGKHEVTQEEYIDITEDEPGFCCGEGDNYPVYQIDWFEAVVYCNTISVLEGLNPCYNTEDWSCDYSANGYRLPTEAEWEYAARGGKHHEDNMIYSGTSDNLDDYAWHEANSDTLCHETGLKFPNQLGIYDMSGNLWEMCNDMYRSDYYSTTDIYDNPQGPPTGLGRSIRGGSWNYSTQNCRVANRGYTAPQTSHYFVGFRVVRKAE